MLANGIAGFVQVLGEMNGVTVMINCVNILNLQATPQMAGDNVGGLDGIDFPSGGLRVISGFFGHA